MRLLRRSSIGEFSLTKDFAVHEVIPPYAILSHTWGADNEEATFEDLTNGIVKDKPGYKKIRFCGEQARQDDLGYFGSIPVVSIRQTKLNSRTQSTPCSAGTATQRDATFICQMSLALPPTLTMTSIRKHGNLLLREVSGSLGAGRSKSFLRLIPSSSSPGNAGDWVIKNR
jgi:hypothetical protein